MRKSLTILSFLVLGLVSACAQKKQVTHRWNVFAGYDFDHGYIANIPESPVSLNGGQASVTYFVTKYAGLTAEFSGMTGTFPTTTASMTNSRYVFGPTFRFDLKSSRYVLFAHQLFGVTHMTFSGLSTQPQSSHLGTANPFTMLSGGGLDVRINHLISVRPFEMDYFNERVSLDALSGGVTHTGLDISTDGFRYTAGVVLHF
jgi:hypothetical protein